MHISLIESRDGCARLREPWNRIVKANARTEQGFDVTATYEWAMALYDNFLAGKPLTVLALEDGGEVVGILPCYFRLHGRRAAPRSSIAVITELNSGRCGFLIKDNAPEYLAAMLRCLVDDIKGWGTFWFTLVDGSASAEALARVASTLPSSVAITGRQASPFVRLPQDVQSLINSRDKKFRANLKNRENRLRKMGRLEYKCYQTTDEARAFLDIVYCIERGSWKERVGSSITTNPHEESFYRILTPRAAEHGWLLGHVLLLNDRPIAYIYGLQFEGIYYDLKESYVEDFNAASPGQVLKTMCFAELCRRGIRGFDFMGAAHSFKMEWADQTYSRNSYVIFNTNLSGKMARLRRTTVQAIRGISGRLKSK